MTHSSGWRQQVTYQLTFEIRSIVSTGTGTGTCTYIHVHIVHTYIHMWTDVHTYHIPGYLYEINKHKLFLRVRTVVGKTGSVFSD